MIHVTKSYLPSKSKYKSYIDTIYSSGWLTNNGSLVQELEKRLSDHLGVKNLICVANGSLALQLIYKALNLSGEVITTPFSFAATTSTLAWEGLTPVFADIDSKSFNIDSKKIEPMISNKTSALVPVHVFGNPCRVEKLQEIASKFDLKLIYDAAHAFDIQYTNSKNQTQSVLNYGDASILSFHATKLFHTIEGGAIITNNDELAKKIRLLINFGITGPKTIESVGTNAKMNEFEAAMGLCVLDDIEAIKAERQKIWSLYQRELDGLLRFQSWNLQSENNYSYAPVLFNSESQLLKVEKKLNERNIFPRRYFYPSLDSLSYLKGEFFCQVSRDISSRILCLPIYPGLETSSLQEIINVIKAGLK